jgi:ABC-type transport system substrate-binding protein
VPLWTEIGDLMPPHPRSKASPHLWRWDRLLALAAEAGKLVPVGRGGERRAIALAVDIDREIRLVRRGQAIPAQSPIGPETWGYDPTFRSEMSSYSVARAKALLDMHGWVDRDGDGWRDQPDGQPLVLEYATSPDQQSRQLSELWKKNMDAIGIRIEFKVAKWPENLKASRVGKLMMWGVGWSAGAPDGDTFLALGYGPNKGQANHARFDLPEFNRLYEKQRLLPDGPEREALFDHAKRLISRVERGATTTPWARWSAATARTASIRSWARTSRAGPKRLSAGA